MGIIRKTARIASMGAVGVPVVRKRSKKDKIVRNTERMAEALEAQQAAARETVPAAPPPAHGPPAGWYQDPEGSSNDRWWDGTRWTEHLQPPS